MFIVKGSSHKKSRSANFERPLTGCMFMLEVGDKRKAHPRVSSINNMTRYKYPPWGDTTETFLPGHYIAPVKTAHVGKRRGIVLPDFPL